MRVLTVQMEVILNGACSGVKTVMVYSSITRLSDVAPALELALVLEEGLLVAGVP